MDDLTRHLIEAACSKLALTASLYMDTEGFDRFAELFTEDGEFVRPSTYPHSPLKGRREIAQTLADRFMGVTSRHICSNLIVEAINEREATASSFFLHISHPDNGAQLPAPMAGSLLSMGEYRDCFVKTEDIWRIKSRIGRFIFRKQP
jgi:SnoaL-like domain